MHRLIAPRDQKHQSNFVEFRNTSKIVYRRYAGLFFCACVDTNDNELAYLEAIHFFVEVLDAFFGNVCELDLVFNFYKVGASMVSYVKLGDGGEGRGGEVKVRLIALNGTQWNWGIGNQAVLMTALWQVYAILDEVFLAGEIEETSKQVVLTRLVHLDKLE